MQYKTIVLELIQQQPELHEQCVRPVNHIFQADRGRGIMFGAPS
jgi:hypothetical protein